MDKKIDMKVLKMFNEGTVRGNKCRLQVLQWNNRTPVLEKREFWIDDTDLQNPGQEKPGKLKGLTLADVEIIEKNLSEIKQLLKGEEIPHA
jgi:hypothetical protein